MKDPFATERRMYHMSKKYADEKLEEAKKYALMQIDALPEPVEAPQLDTSAIAQEVMAMLPKPKKLKNKKKASKGIEVVSPEDVMAMIMGSLDKVNQEIKEGDTIVINEAPQRVMETVREVIRETGGEVDYDEIYKQLDRRFIEWRATVPMAGGGASALSMMTDVNLDAVPQDKDGNYILGGSTGSSSQSFETVSKNLNSYPFSVNYSGTQITSVVYTVPAGTITKSITYNGDNNVASVTLSGDLPSTITEKTKTITYTSGKITSVSYS